MHNFPIQTTSFIGREKEIGFMIGLIEKHRLVTFSGTGGCGKTRLACKVVEKMVKDYPDGIWFVDLAPVETVDLVAKQLMTTLGLSEIPGGDMMKIVTESIRNKKLLFLLDNCEHLLITCAEISRRLIESVPGLSLVVTSREPLNIKGEKVWKVPSLTLIEPATDLNVEQAGKSEAIRLFTERAQLTNTGFKLVEKNVSTVSTICHKLDGLPLAIELVASRTRYMDTKTMLDRLSERFDIIPSLDPGTISRHQTIQAAIDWSYNLLSEQEKTLFRQLGVFSGEFDLTAAEEVCVYETLSRESVLDLLSLLVDRSMIQTVYLPGEQMRYKVLETLQRYASGLLVEKGEETDTRKKHLKYFTRIAEEAHEERVSFQEKWIGVLQKEHENMLGALNWADLHDPESYCVLAGSLSWFWAANSHYATARRYLEKVVTGHTGNKMALARAVTGYGVLLSNSGDLQRALKLLHQGLSLWRELKNRKEEILVLEQISYGIMFTGEDNDSVVKYAKEALSLAKQLEDPGIELHAAIAVAQGLVLLKNTGEARPVIHKMQALAEEVGNLYGTMAAHHLLGDCAIIEEQYIESESEYGKCMLSAFNLGDTFQTCMELLFVAMSVAGQGRHAKALRLNSAVTWIAKASGFNVPEESEVTFMKELINLHIIGTREKLGKVLTRKYEEEGRTMSLEKAMEYALDVETD